jgi:hypothetical protein
MTTKLSRWSPLLGVLFTACLATAFFGPSTPDVNDSSAKVISFYSSHRGAIEFQGYVLAYGAIFLVAYIAVLSGYLRRMGSDALSRVCFAGSVILAIAMAVGSAINFMLTHRSVTLDASSAQTLNLMNNDLYYIALAVGTALTMLAAGIAIVSTKAMPAWLGWVAIVAGVVAASPLAWIGLMVFGLWALVTSIVLYQRTASAPAATITLPEGSVPVPAQAQSQETTTTIRT